LTNNRFQTSKSCHDLSVLEKQVKTSFPPLNRVTNSSGFLGDLAAVHKTLYLQEKSDL